MFYLGWIGRWLLIVLVADAVMSVINGEPRIHEPSMYVVALLIGTAQAAYEKRKASKAAPRD